MRAIIFAAGLGTRLKPLTDHCPKALVRVNGQPLLWHSIQFLKKAGITEVVVNVHHFSGLIIDYLKKNQFGVSIHISDESDELLDTGGGMLKARRFLDGSDPFIACNVDVISSVDLKKAIDYHNLYDPLATLVVRERETKRNFLFDENMILTGWRNSESGEEIVTINKKSSPWAFSGIQIISPKIFDLITEQGKFSITPLYLRLAQQNTIIGYPDPSDFWIDLGNTGQLSIAEKYLSDLKS